MGLRDTLDTCSAVTHRILQPIRVDVLVTIHRIHLGDSTSVTVVKKTALPLSFGDPARRKPCSGPLASSGPDVSVSSLNLE